MIRTYRPAGHPTAGPVASRALDDHGHPLPTADAHGLESDLAVERLEVVEQRSHDPRPCHSEWMTERDRPSMRVHAVRGRIEPKLAADRKHLGRECLVELHDLDVVGGHARDRK